MTGMEHAIEQAAGVMDKNFNPDRYPIMAAMFRDYARALADAGLLAPAPLRQEWGSEMRNARPESSSHVLCARDRDNAQRQIEHNPEWATGRIMHRYRTAWLPVDAIERATTPQEGIVTTVYRAYSPSRDTTHGVTDDRDHEVGTVCIDEISDLLEWETT